MRWLPHGCGTEQVRYFKGSIKNMKHFFKLAVIFLFVNNAYGQSKLFTKSAKISFFSKTPMENISAVTNKAVSVWDLSSGQIEFSVLIKGFEFDRALMQEHFNENYMESDLYPKATFKGVVENPAALVLTKDNTYKVKIIGSLTMHGVTKPLSIPATIVVKGGTVSASAGFTVAAEDYKIKIPSIVAEKISKQITVNVDVPSYQNLK
jgi:hypothetical protein